MYRSPGASRCTDECRPRPQRRPGNPFRQGLTTGTPRSGPCSESGLPGDQETGSNQGHTRKHDEKVIIDGGTKPWETSTAARHITIAYARDERRTPPGTPDVPSARTNTIAPGGAPGIRQMRHMNKTGTPSELCHRQMARKEQAGTECASPWAFRGGSERGGRRGFGAPPVCTEPRPHPCPAENLDHHRSLPTLCSHPASRGRSGLPPPTRGEYLSRPFPFPQS